VVRLRLSAYDVEGETTEAEITAQFDTLRTIIGDNIVGYEGSTLEQQIHEILTARGERLAVAESCTGGTIASKFTAMAGASAYFMAGVVSYSNEAKHDILGVSWESLNTYGAVSEQVAREMAEGMRRVAHADYAIATTGIAGPTGGSEAKPVGTVWIAIATPSETLSRRMTYGQLRTQNIERATTSAINLLRLVLLGKANSATSDSIL
jgi:nicotinamide-nucleotide amidase